MLPAAIAQVASVVGRDIPEEWWSLAALVAGMTAALDVEISFYPDEVAAGDSAYDKIKELRDERLTILMDGVAEDPNSEDVSTVDSSLSPSYAFPEDLGGMVGWGTEF